MIFIIVVVVSSCYLKGKTLVEKVPFSSHCSQMAVQRTDPLPLEALSFDTKLLIKKRLQLAEKQLEKVQIEKFVKIQPIMRWSQNRSHVFITWKLSHRWDAPPCTSTQHRSINYTANGLQFFQSCIMSNFHYEFKFDLDLHAAVSNITAFYEGPYWVMRAQKQQHVIWAYPTSQNIHYPIWKAMAQRYEVEHEEYERLKEQQANTLPKKKRRKKKQVEQEGQTEGRTEKPIDIQDL